jgi:hypothetical protein
VKNPNIAGRRIVGAVFTCLAISIGTRVAAVPSAGASAKALDAVLDPKTGLKEIADAVNAGKAPPADRFFLVPILPGDGEDRRDDR